MTPNALSLSLITLATLSIFPYESVAQNEGSAQYLEGSRCEVSFESKKTNVISMLVIRATYAHMERNLTQKKAIQALNEAVVNRRCNVNSVDYMGLSGLHIAIVKSDVSIVKTLLRLGADLALKIEVLDSRYYGKNAKDLAEIINNETPSAEALLIRDTLVRSMR